MTGSLAIDEHVAMSHCRSRSTCSMSGSGSTLPNMAQCLCVSSGGWLDNSTSFFSVERSLQESTIEKSRQSMLPL